MWFKKRKIPSIGDIVTFKNWSGGNRLQDPNAHWNIINGLVLEVGKNKKILRVKVDDKEIAPVPISRVLDFFPPLI